MLTDSMSQLQLVALGKWSVSGALAVRDPAIGKGSEARNRSPRSLRAHAEEGEREKVMSTGGLIS